MLKLKKIKPLFNQVLVTKDLYESDVYDHGMVVKTRGTVKEFQKVVAVGSTVKVCAPGDTVMINPTRYAVMKHQEGSLKDGVIADNPVVKYNIPIVTLNDKEYMLIYDTDIHFIMEDFEEVDDSSGIMHVKNPIILP